MESLEDRCLPQATPASPQAIGLALQIIKLGEAGRTAPGDATNQLATQIRANPAQGVQTAIGLLADFEANAFLAQQILLADAALKTALAEPNPAERPFINLNLQQLANVNQLEQPLLNGLNEVTQNMQADLNLANQLGLTSVRLPTPNAATDLLAFFNAATPGPGPGGRVGAGVVGAGGVGAGGAGGVGGLGGGGGAGGGFGAGPFA